MTIYSLPSIINLHNRTSSSPTLITVLIGGHTIRTHFSNSLYLIKSHFIHPPLSLLSLSLSSLTPKDLEIKNQSLSPILPVPPDSWSLIANNSWLY
ncbi:hypothetical protein HanRHA438_Chr11g0513081 [Helianthus annuus]|nr:hypothetical protein HanIR_Chr11g0538651 [Helianthus annuus]KAJ0871501.1 hypothetical protein HanRHA438_Chr11g0513081 [Helianthus annuus]